MIFVVLAWPNGPEAEEQLVIYSAGIFPSLGPLGTPFTCQTNRYSRQKDVNPTLREVTYASL